MKHLGMAIAIAATMVATPMRCAPLRSCPQFESMLTQYAPEPAWDIGRMSSIMHRESRCTPDAYNATGKAVGLLQITPISYPYLTKALGEPINRWTLTDAATNIRAGAALCEYWMRAGRSCYQPWAL